MVVEGGLPPKNGRDETHAVPISRELFTKFRLVFSLMAVVLAMARFAGQGILRQILALKTGCGSVGNSDAVILTLWGQICVGYFSTSQGRLSGRLPI